MILYEKFFSLLSNLVCYYLHHPRNPPVMLPPCISAILPKVNFHFSQYKISIVSLFLFISSLPFSATSHIMLLCKMRALSTHHKVQGYVNANFSYYFICSLSFSLKSRLSISGRSSRSVCQTCCKLPH